MRLSIVKVMSDSAPWQLVSVSKLVMFQVRQEKKFDKQRKAAARISISNEMFQELVKELLQKIEL